MKKPVIANLLLTIFTAIVLFFIFKPVILNPNSYLFSKHGDALKSYYNFAYYLKFDSGFRHDGVNYPYGEHIQFMNTHPLYAQVIKFIDNHFVPLADYGVGILNLTMIISLLLAAPILFLILRKFSLPSWYAALTAFIILFLTPQLDRIHGHFEMVYAFFIPLYWYLLMRWKENNKPFLWGTLLVLSGMVGGFTMPYLVALYAVLVLGVWMVETWVHRKKLNEFLKPGITLLFLAIIPLIAVRGLSAATDWVDDRPFHPWGFFVFYATPLSIFLPFQSPLKFILGDYVNMNFSWEGRAYVGFPATILALSICFWLLYHLFTKKKLRWKVFFPEKNLNIYLAAAVLALLFSMALPFRLGLQWMLDIFTPIRQFRGIGRFAWIFYYVFSVYTAYYLYVLFRRLRFKNFSVMARLILIFALSYWLIDAGTNVKQSIRGIFNKNDKLESSDVEFLSRFEESGVDPDAFQAIFFLPFANTCGDKLYFERGLNAFGDAMKCSYHTGLPIIQSFSPRLSFSQALSSIQLLADSCIQKKRLMDMNDKPVLLVSTKETLTEREKKLQSQSSVFWEDEYITMASLPVNAFESGYNTCLEHFRELRDSLKCQSRICVDFNRDYLIYNGFEDRSAEFVFGGEGAWFEKKGEITLVDQIFYKSDSVTKINLSFWMYIDPRMYDMPKVTVKRWDKDGNRMDNIKIENRQIHNVYNHWARISKTIDIERDVKYQLTVKGKFITVDELIVKPVATNIYAVFHDSTMLFNNYLIQ